jgi:hypothetical protein
LRKIDSLSNVEKRFLSDSGKEEKSFEQTIQNFSNGLLNVRIERGMLRKIYLLSNVEKRININ